MEKEATQDPNAVSRRQAPSGTEDGEARLNGKSPRIRYASDEQFKKAQQKTSRLHAGLFRRLSE